MGESKLRRKLLENTTKRLSDVDVSNLTSASSDQVRELYTGITRLLRRSFEAGMQADVASQVVMAVSIDTWRTNYGDESCLAALTSTVERRLQYSLEFWSGRERRDGETAE